jgi:beta-glucosidase
MSAMKFTGNLFVLLTATCVFTTAAPAAQPAPSAEPAPPAATEKRVNAAIVPAPRDVDRARQRFEELNQRVKAAQGQVDLVFLGDSITQGWEGNGKAVWQRYYAHRKALNLGIGGDRTQHVLWRLEHGNLDGIKPKVVVVMIGTNNSNRDDHTPAEILEGVTAVVDLLRAKLPETRILLLSIFPRGATFNDQRGKILQVNQALAKLDDNRTVFYLDFGHRLIEKDGSISKTIMPDYLHLSEQGYRIWAESIEPKLAELLGDRPVPAGA